MSFKRNRGRKTNRKNRDLCQVEDPNDVIVIEPPIDLTDSSDNEVTVIEPNQCVSDCRPMSSQNPDSDDDEIVLIEPNSGPSNVHRPQNPVENPVEILSHPINVPSSETPDAGRETDDLAVGNNDMTSGQTMEDSNDKRLKYLVKNARCMLEVEKKNLVEIKWDQDLIYYKQKAFSHGVIANGLMSKVELLDEWAKGASIDLLNQATIIKNQMIETILATQKECLEMERLIPIYTVYKSAQDLYAKTRSTELDREWGELRKRDIPVVKEHYAQLKTSIAEQKEQMIKVEDQKVMLERHGHPAARRISQWVINMGKYLNRMSEYLMCGTRHMDDLKVKPLVDRSKSHRRIIEGACLCSTFDGQARLSAGEKVNIIDSSNLFKWTVQKADGRKLSVWSFYIRITKATGQSSAGSAGAMRTTARGPATRRSRI
uniref:SH3_10 domain-containing protein n=2 Tax=Caenorhabditis tropicalis TaxID=1561998 RepID=A0A1I7TUV9_9PELO